MNLLNKLRIRTVQVLWFSGKPLFHYWPYPSNFRQRPIFNGHPIMWRLAIGFCEIRIFPK